MAFPEPFKLFPFDPNWGASFDETFAFRSWVIPAKQGNEQTGSVSGRGARRRFEYEVLLKRNAAQRFHGLMFSWMGRFFELPHWADKTTLDAPVVTGQTVLPMDTTYRTFVPGGRLVIYHDEANFESREIVAVTDSSVTIAAPGLAKAWPAYTRVYPTLPALVNASLEGNQLTDTSLRAPVSFEAEPSAADPNIPVLAADEMYRGYELYLGRLNWANPLEFSFEVSRQALDFGGGKMSTHSASQYSVRSRKHNWLMKTREEGHQFRAWLGRRQGRAVPVYMPTGNADFTLIDSIGPGETFIDVEDNLYGELAGAHPALRDILIRCRDGRKFARRITGATALGNSQVRLALDAAIPDAVDKDGVKHISYLGLYRQAADDTTIRWMTDLVGVAECTLVPKYTMDN